MSDVRRVVGVILLFIKGAVKLLSQSRDGLKFEESMHRLWQDVGGKLYTHILEQLDIDLMANRDKASWKVVGIRERTQVTSFGEVTIRRRLYREVGGEKRYVFLLDQAMGWPKNSRLSLRMKKMSISFAKDTSFRRTAKALEFLTPGVSAMSVWQEVQKAGELARREAEARKEQMFSAGQYEPGKQVAKALYIEADGVHVKQQRRNGEGAKSMELKMATMYEGKEKLASGKMQLKGKQTVAGFIPGPDLWERVSERCNRRWDLSRVQQVHVGGDGAKWIKQGVKMFPGAQYHLDAFHLRRALTRALSFHDEHYQTVAGAVSKMNWQGVEEGIEKALATTRSAKRKKKIRNLGKYLKDNWEGIGKLPDGHRMGVVEAQVRHVLARRMKHISGGWSTDGADCMAHLLAADANGELKQYVPGRTMDQKTLSDAITRCQKRGKESKPVSEEDVEEWLKVNMPALTGPHAGRPWIKYVLKEISKMPALWGVA